MKEAELYPAVKAYLEAQGYEVKGEIGEADVMAVRGAEPPVIVELKTGFTLALAMQSVARQSWTPARTYRSARLCDSLLRGGSGGWIACSRRGFSG